MNDKSEKQDWITIMNIRLLIPRGALTVDNIATIGRPFPVQYVKIPGACTRRARPYRIREAAKRKLFPAENALVKMQALMIWGKTVFLNR